MQPPVENQTEAVVYCPRLFMRFVPLYPVGGIWPSTYVGAAVLALSVALPLPRESAILGLPSPCPFFHLTGLPCPGCGLTRSFVSFAHGHIADAFAWHPLGPLLFGATAAYTVWSFWARKQPVRIAPQTEIRVLSISAAIMVAFWALRLGGVFPMPN